MSSNFISINTSPARSYKDIIKINLGRLLAKLCSKRSDQLSEQPISHPVGWKDKMLMAFLKEQARVLNDSDFFQQLHIDFWQGEGGEVFSSNCDHRFEDFFLAKQTADLIQLQKYWSQGNFQHIVEIGCCAGLHLQHLVGLLPDVKSAIGIDINPVQIQANQNNPKFDPRISFTTADGSDWIFDNGKPNTLFVTNGGVLEYFSQTRLNELFGFVAKQLAPAIVFTVEPTAGDHQTTDSIPFGEELSFCHNYRHLYESNGLEVVHQRTINYQSWQMTTTIAHAVSIV